MGTSRMATVLLLGRCVLSLCCERTMRPWIYVPGFDPGPTLGRPWVGIGSTRVDPGSTWVYLPWVDTKRGTRCEARNMKPDTRNTQHGTRRRKHGTRIAKRETRNTKHEQRNSKHEAINTKRKTRHHEACIRYQPTQRLSYRCVVSAAED